MAVTMRAGKLKWKDQFMLPWDNKRIFTCEGHRHEDYIWVSWKSEGVRHTGEVHVSEKVTLVKEGLGK